MADRFTDGYFTVRDGLKLHFRDYPGPHEKPPLLCLPGLTRNVRDFAAFAERHSPDWRVVCLEFRGRGESQHDPKPERYTPITYVHDTIALLDHLGIADAVYVGTSLGGIVTMLTAVIEEERIAAAILNDVGPELEEAGLERIKGYVGSGATYADWDAAAAAVATVNRDIPAHYDAAGWQRMARRLASERPDGTIAFDYDQAIALPFASSGPTAQVDMWPFFDALAQKPLLVLRGELSDLLSAAALERMEARVPGVVTATIPGVAHTPDLEEPATIAAIDAFLASLDV